MTVTSYIRRPHATRPASLTAAQVAAAYNFPAATGKGATVGLIELGGGYDPSAFTGWDVTAVSVRGGGNDPDGANGADGEVQLDIEVVLGVAPHAAVRVYFAPNTDEGFTAAVAQAMTECSYVSCSWGQAENQWPHASITAMSAVLKAGRAAGSVFLAAAGDSGSDDSTSSAVTDYPASDPNAIGCGGTRLTLDSAGSRASEVAWDDNDRTSATGGGVSRVFPGRQVPDIAGNADPDTGYRITVDGEPVVVGGTSAVAPLYAGLLARLHELLGGPVGKRVDLLNTLATNAGVCFDVTSGDNGAYRAGPGRDEVTGLGVVDGTKLLAVLSDAVADPAPIPSPAPSPAPQPTDAFAVFAAVAAPWAAKKHRGDNGRMAAATRAYLLAAAGDARVTETARPGHVHIDAGTGRFVSAAYAEANPTTTVRISE